MVDFLKNLVGSKVDVLCTDGSSLENRTLMAVDATGLVLSRDSHWTAVPMHQVDYMIATGTSS